MNKKRIVITGMGAVSCFGSDVDHFYQQMIAGKSGITPITQFPCEEYPTRFAGSVAGFDVGEYLDKKQARRFDPCMQYGVVAGKKALEHAGFNLHNINVNKERCGILLSTGMGGMHVYEEGVETIYNKSFKRLTPFFVPYIITNMPGAILAIETGFMGPNYSISTACATSSYAIIAAAQHLRDGHADLMLCGGTEAAILPCGLAGFVACKALSERNDNPQAASRPWDKNRDGFVMGEGAGVLVLETLEHALARGATILGEYLGGSMTCDAYHMTDPHPEGKGVALCIKNTLNDANIPSERVNYINAHATSTLVGDLAEVRAIKSVFGTHCKNIRMNATKSLIGHGLGAAGAFGAIATIQAIRTGKLHPTLNLDDPEPEALEINIVGKEAADHTIDVGIINAFGFGGHNSCVALAPYQGPL